MSQGQSTNSKAKTHFLSQVNLHVYIFKTLSRSTTTTLHATAEPNKYCNNTPTVRHLHKLSGSFSSLYHEFTVSEPCKLVA